MKTMMAGVVLLPWLTVAGMLAADSAGSTNAAPGARINAMMRAHRLTGIIGTSNAPRAVFIYRPPPPPPPPQHFAVGVGEQLSNSTMIVRSIDAATGAVTLDDGGVLLHLQLREQRMSTPPPPRDRAPKVAPPPGMVVLNFEETDLRTVLLYLAELTGLPVVPAPNVRGHVTLINPQPMSREQAIEAVIALIESHNLKVIRQPDLIKVVPLAQHAVAPLEPARVQPAP
jgi:hypothetical protein